MSLLRESVFTRHSQKCVPITY
ncbi:hypothetical protein NC652_005548 [Populus alba x Populus x berolinensis]|uniref:Uncharacterized protein n=1 Tax=Populus alba x Populus x berolinensis TaxID=444605 RepID=A0AAD6WC00_9ROSI|nr:hypothetical protein NC651_005279 [Populus alba x Populus x berolinensis]KAJ6953845.1 hypothetical protein NC652_005548 [Populus alba x Populus x berolinensis]KAJ7006216.1 hypothetical protein NC653_005542 [Populus alba x Populus x berolinensis]